MDSGSSPTLDNSATTHCRLPVDKTELDAWMLCMANAIVEQPYADAFKEYLLTQLFILPQIILTQKQQCVKPVRAKY